MFDPRVQRVLMTGDTVGGVWTFTLNLAAALELLGIEVILAAMGGYPTCEQQAQASALANLTLLVNDRKLDWMDDPWHDVAESGRWLLDLERYFAPDVIHLNNYGFGSLPWRAPVLLTAHSCVLSWWRAVKGEHAPASWNRYRQEVEGSLKAANWITAPSPAMLHTLVENYGPELPRAQVIFNGCDGAVYQPAPKEPFILSAGRVWDEAKNIAAVARAANHLPWPVYVAGESRHPNGAGAGFAGCHMLGRLPRQTLADWYARASIYALPARYEPFGLSVLEAALAGCALVLGDIDSLREVWGDTAEFVPPDDHARFEVALRALIEYPTRRAALAHRSRARALTFSAGRMARAYAGIYQSLAGMRRMACAS